MSLSRILVGTIALGLVVVFTAGAMRVQDRDDLAKRVDLLETRVQKLESILFATAKLSVMEARQELAQAKQIFRDSERLHMRGFINEMALQQDRFRLDQAQRQLDLALTQNDQQVIVGEIDLLEARRDLENAQASLEYTQKLFDRGFVSGTELDRAQQDILQFRKRLELAENKASAAEELYQLGKPTVEDADLAKEKEDPADKK